MLRPEGSMESGLPREEARPKRVAYFRPDIDEDDVAAVAAVVRSGWLTSGPAVAEFERNFCEITGARHAVAVNSCTSGLQAALLAAGIGPGDEVLTTPMTFCGTVRAVEEAGAQPVLVDTAEDLNIDCGALHKHLTSRTRALLPVHMAGLPCELAELEQFAARHGLAMVEDAAHAFGAAAEGNRRIGGGESSTAVFSFYANKNLTTGEGGMMTTADAEHARKLRRLIRHGIERPDPQANSGWQYEVVERGLKFNMSDMLAALGVAQLKKAERHRVRREEIANFYNEALAECEELELPPMRAGTRHAWHLYILRLRLERLRVDRNGFISELAREGVECSVHFKPIPMHRWFARYGSMEQWPNARRQYERVVSLPMYPALSDEELEHVVRSVKQAALRCRTRATVATA